MAQLIQSLGLCGYRQYETGMGRFQHANGTVRNVGGYTTQPPSWRLSGGMRALIEKLCKDIPDPAIRLGHPVCQIQKRSSGVKISVGELEQPPKLRLKAKKIILALPPRLAAATILFSPDLSHTLTQAMLKTGTWMAGQAKFCALYPTPFWRDTGLSGQAFSESGPLGEIHDGSNNDKEPSGLTGFLGIPAIQRHSESALTDAMLSQLALLFGQRASQPSAFFYQDWARERFTATEFAPPHV